MDIMTTIANAKVVPVVVIKDLSEAEPTLRALCEGGLPIAEITFRNALEFFGIQA